MKAADAALRRPDTTGMESCGEWEEREATTKMATREAELLELLLFVFDEINIMID